MDLRLALMIQCGVMTMALALAALFLWRRGVFSLLHSGPWVLFAIGLYFVGNPAISLFDNDLTIYREALAPGDGASRIFWILGVVLVGMALYLYVYSRGGRTRVEITPIKPGRWSSLDIALVVVFLGLSLYSVLFLWTGDAFVNSSVSIQSDQGRIVGGATGYSIVAQAFFLFIVVFLLLRGPRKIRRLGAALALGFIALRMYDAHDRASIVSLMAAIGMVSVIRRRQGNRGLGRVRTSRLRMVLAMAATVAMAVFLVMRGHTSVADMSQTNWDQGAVAFRQNDTAMLPTLYAQSYAYEQYGYDYGLPFVNSALTGWLPRQYFPWKDDMPRLVLGRADIRYSGLYDRWFVGPKSTILGSFYGHGGGLGVLLGMAFLGFATRRLDKLVARGKTDLGRAIGIVWMANIWIMFGSGDTWVISNMFATGMPFIGMWIANRLEGRRGTRRQRRPAPAASMVRHS